MELWSFWMTVLPLIIITSKKNTHIVDVLDIATIYTRQNFIRFICSLIFYILKLNTIVFASIHNCLSFKLTIIFPTSECKIPNYRSLVIYLFFSYAFY